MTLVDSSAWVEFLSASGSVVDQLLTNLVASGEELVSTGPVEMELLAGSADPRQREAILSALRACRNVEVDEVHDWEAAADVYLACRRAGVTPRKLLDCLIAAIAIRSGVPVLAQDRDFKLIAEHTSLQLA